MKNYLNKKSIFITLVLISIILMQIFNYPLVNRTAILAIVTYILVRFLGFKITLVLGLSLLTLLPAIIQLVSELFDDNRIIKVTDFARYGIFGNRTIVWIAAIEALFRDNLFFTGYGLGNDVVALSRENTEKFKGLHAHSVIFSGILEFGLLPFKLFLFFTLLLIYVGLRKIQDRKLKIKAIAFISTLFVLGLFDTLYLKPTNPLFAIFWLFIISINQKTKRRTVA